MDDLWTDLLFLAVFAAFVGLRWWLGHVIGNAAMRRGCGFMGWVISALIFGPLVVWIVYLIFVHWRPSGRDFKQNPMELSLNDEQES